MSGEKDFLDKKMEEAIGVLEKMSQSMLLDKINVNHEVEKYLSMREEFIEKMTPAELATGEYILSSYSLVVQRKLNRANAIHKYANTCFEKILAKSYGDFDQMMKYEARRAAVSNSNDYAKRLSDIMSEQELITNDLTFVSQSINHLSNSLGNLARIRSKNNGYATRDN